MALPVTIPNTFANATTSIPLSQLDTNFSTLANAVNGINSGSEILANLKSSNVTITGGVISNVTLDNVTVDVETLSNVTINGGNVTVTNMVATTANATTGNITTVIVGAGTSAAPSITFTGDTNTGIFSPAADTIAFAEGGVESMRIDSSGNLGLGATPSAWGNGRVALQLKSNGALYSGDNLAALSSNAYDDGSFKYMSTNAASLYENRLGQHAWYNAASGTAGNTISFTQAMTLDASGRLILGDTTADGRLKVVETAAGAGVTFYNSANNSAGQIGTTNESGTVNGLEINAYRGDGKIVFKTAATERMRIDSSGNVGIGTTSPAYKLDVVSTSMRIASGSTGVGYVQYGNSSTATNNWHVGTEGDGTFRFFNGNVGSGTERARITSGGDLLVGTTDDGFFNGSTRGVGCFGSNGFVAASRNGGVSAIFNRYTSDGDVVQFRRSGTAVGSVSVTTTATAYNTSSDYRLKNTIAPMTGALAKVSQLKPVTYKWNADGSDGEGFIAHELAEVCPQAVTGEKDGEEMQGVDYGKITPLLTAALQEAIAEIQSLKARIAVLEAK